MSSEFRRGGAVAAVAFGVWMSLNIALSFLNRYLFVYKHFTYPMLIIILGTLATLVGSSLALLCRVEKPHWDRCRANWRTLLALAVIHGIDVGLENFSIVYISISINQIIKATVPAMTLVLSYFIEGKRYSVQLQLATALTVVGAILGVLRDSSHVSNTSAAAAADHRTGVLAACVSAAAAAVSTVLLGVLLQRAHIGAVAVAAVTSLPSALVLVPPFLLFELPALNQSKARHGAAVPQAERYVAPLLGGVCVLALLYNLSRLYLIKFTAAHYSVVAGSVKVGVIVILSMIIFGDHADFSARNWAGLALSLLGFSLYSYFKFQQTKARTARQQQKAELEEAASAVPLQIVE